MPPSDRKADHLDLCANADVGFREKSTWIECVELVHDALPELDYDAIDTTTRVLGKTLRVPLVIAGMTGGTDRAGAINRALAACAERHQIAFGLGSQRPMLRDPKAVDTYRVRDVAPSALVFGNIGIVQARDIDTEAVQGLVDAIGADALCVHLNPSQELVQHEGDRDFRGGIETLARLAEELSVPVIVKETGAGLSRGVVERLVAQTGVRHVDVGGAGGTSWTAVETHRAQSSGHTSAEAIGRLFWDWGIPTAAAVVESTGLGLETIIATGGMHTGVDAARAIAIGAGAVGMARPMLKAFEGGGEVGLDARVQQFERELRSAMLLTGAGRLADLRDPARRFIRGPLADWIGARSAHRSSSR